MPNKEYLLDNINWNWTFLPSIIFINATVILKDGIYIRFNWTFLKDLKKNNQLLNKENLHDNNMEVDFLQSYYSNRIIMAGTGDPLPGIQHFRQVRWENLYFIVCHYQLERSSNNRGPLQRWLLPNTTRSLIKHSIQLYYECRGQTRHIPYLSCTNM